MISFVVCRYNNSVFEKLLGPSVNVQIESCGGELVEVRSTRSIFEAYEYGRKMAQYDIIAYVHEDVKFLEKDAAKKIAKYFDCYPNLGMLGVLGSFESDYVPWWDNATMLGHFVSPSKKGVVEKKSNKGNVESNHWDKLLYTYAGYDGRFHCEPIANSLLSNNEVFANLRIKWDSCQKAGFIDGFFMAERRSQIEWDTKSYKGWHCYDLDRSLQIRNAGWDVMIGDLLVMHDMQRHSATWYLNHLINLDKMRRKWGCKRYYTPPRLRNLIC